MSGMLEVKSFIFGPFQTNTYVVSNGQQVFIIDPACYSQYEQQALCTYIEKELQCAPSNVTILATHGHLDHLWGAAWACEKWHTSVLMHEADIPMATAMQGQYDLFGIHAIAQPFPIEPLNDKEIPFSILHTPGHTPGSVCFYWPNDNILLSGDTLFHMGYGRTDLPGGDIRQLIDSLDCLMTLPSDTRVFPGHGDATTIAAERR